MPLTLQEQYALAMQAVPQGDMDLLSRMLVDPQSITTEDSKTVAQSLGMERGFLAGAVNILSDPMVWLSMLASRTFPVSSWLKGSIPKRFIGTANEFTGISHVTRPIEDFFRGTPVARLDALKIRREAEVMKAAKPYFTEIMTRPRWKEEAPIVSLLLEGQSHPGATPELKLVAERLRSMMDQLWGFLKQTKKVSGGFEGMETTRARAEDWAPHEAPRYLRDYLPHIPLIGETSIIEVGGKEALRRLGGHGLTEALRLKGMDIYDVWTLSQGNRLAADFSRWQGFVDRVGGFLNPRLFQRTRLDLTLQSKGSMGQDLFYTDLNVLLPRYLHSVARTYANYSPLSDLERKLASVTIRSEDGTFQNVTPSSDPLLVQIINYGLDAAGGQYRRSPIPGTSYVRETLVPGSYNVPTLSALNRLVRSVRGDFDDSEMLFGNMYSTVMRKLDQWKGQLSGKQITEVDLAVKTIERTHGYRRQANGLASYFYASTLGLNPWAAIQNILQPVLTTMPAIGIGPTLKGYSVLKDRIPRYASAVVRNHRSIRHTEGALGLEKINLAAERAFHEIFPELAAQGIRIDPRLFDLAPEQVLPSLALGGSLWRNLDSWNRFILQPFTHAEMSNQIVSFYGTKDTLRNMIRTGQYRPDKLLLANPALTEELLNFESGLVVNATQFRPGSGSRTIVQSALPPPLRQFTSFPIRHYNFLVDSTIRGAMSQAELQQAGVLDALSGGQAGEMARRKLFSLGTGRNLGTIARSLLYGRIATEGASQVLDIDLSRSLGLNSFLMEDRSGLPFAPLPLPPLASTTLGIVSAATNRDIKRLQPMRLPYLGDIPIPKALVPGGVGISRTVRAIQQFRPDLGGFVDDDERLMYQGNTTDLLLASLGVPLDKNRRARDAIEKTQDNRRRIIGFRREFAVAKMNMDFSRMGSLREDFSKAFPGFPPLEVSPGDVRRVWLNAHVPAVQRTLRALGQSGRYLEQDLYEHDPDLLSPLRLAG